MALVYFCQMSEKLPKFLIGDNTDQPDTVYIVHTHYPRFILDLDSEEIEWMEDVEVENENELTDEIVKLLQEADEFYQRELDRYEEEEEQEKE